MSKTEVFNVGDRVLCSPSLIEGEVKAIANFGVVYVRLEKGEVIAISANLLLHSVPVCTICGERHQRQERCTKRDPPFHGHRLART